MQCQVCVVRGNDVNNAGVTGNVSANEKPKTLARRLDPSTKENLRG